LIKRLAEAIAPCKQKTILKSRLRLPTLFIELIRNGKNSAHGQKEPASKEERLLLNIEKRRGSSFEMA
jgi:hypothetical protein